MYRFIIDLRRWGNDAPFGRRLSRRDFVVRGGAGLMGAMLLGASGCGGNGTSQKRASVEGAKILVKGEGGGEEVVFWTSFTGPVDVASLTKIVKTFNEQSSDATVTMVQVPGDETDVSKLMTAVRGGVGPDVYHLDRFTTSERTRRSRSLRWTGLAHRPGPAHLRLRPLRRPGPRTQEAEQTGEAPGAASRSLRPLRGPEPSPVGKQPATVPVARLRATRGGGWKDA